MFKACRVTQMMQKRLDLSCYLFWLLKLKVFTRDGKTNNYCSEYFHAIISKMLRNKIVHGKFIEPKCFSKKTNNIFCYVF